MESHGSTPAGTRVTSIALAFTLIAGTAVFLRLFTRLVLTRVTGFEDACIVFAMALSISLTVMISAQVSNGLGRHDSELNPKEHLNSLKAFWATLWIYSMALTFTKVSILVQYLRIFPVRRFQKVCYGVLLFVVVFGIWTIFGNIFMCTPIKSFWKQSMQSVNCMDRQIVWFTNAAVNIAQDIVILLLPMPLIQTLQVSRGQKRGLVIMFGLGATVSIVSVTRLYSLHDIAKSVDISWDNPAHASLSAVEVNVAIICACLPAMRPLLALLMPTYFSAAAQYTNVPRKLDLDGSWFRKETDAGTYSETRSNTPRQFTYTPTTHNLSRAGTPQTHRPSLSRTSTPQQTHRPSLSRTSTPQNHQSNLSRTSTPHTHRPSLSRTTTPKSHHRFTFSRTVTPPRPVLSRNSSGHFIVHNSHHGTPPIEQQPIIAPFSYTHTRTGSNISIDIAAAEARSSKRALERVHPLRMSPVRADNPLSPTRMSMRSIGPGFFTFRPSKETLRVVNPDEVRRSQRSEMRMSAKPLPLTPFPVPGGVI